MEGLLGLIGIQGLTLSAIAVVAIPFLVNLIKKVKFIGVRFAPLLAFVLGAIAGIIGFYTGVAPEGATLLGSIIIGITLGGTSTGLYDLNKKTIRNQ